MGWHGQGETAVHASQRFVGQGNVRVERVKGIEPSSQPWEGHILPLNHTRCRWTSFYQSAARRATAVWRYWAREKTRGSRPVAVEPLTGRDRSN